ncbi:MAG TPA: hypothetical protein V6D26_18825, partial [Stenomitos sp.]
VRYSGWRTDAFKKSESVLQRSNALGYRHSPSYLERRPKRSDWQQSVDDDTPVEVDCLLMMLRIEIRVRRRG